MCRFVKKNKELIKDIILKAVYLINAYLIIKMTIRIIILISLLITAYLKKKSKK